METSRNITGLVDAAWGTIGRRRFAVLFALALLVAASVLAAFLVQPHAAQAGSPSGTVAVSGPDWVPGEVIAQFDGGTTSLTVSDVAKGVGAVVTKEVFPTEDGAPRIALVMSATDSAQALLAKLQNAPGVLAVSLNYIRRVTVVPNDPLFGQEWGLNNTGQTGGVSDDDIDAPEAWNTTTGSPTVIVADIDTGVDYTHPDLAANMWHNPGEIPGDHIDNDHNGHVDDVYGIDPVGGDSDPMDQNGHGTHTSGTMAAVGNNGIGVSGVGWNTEIMALRFLDASGSGSDMDAITCINYVIDQKVNHGQNVVAINASWGSTFNDTVLKSAIDSAGSAGIVFCAAAGNNGTNSPFYPASFGSSNIISVAATDSSDQLPSWSNYGSTNVDLAAPGVGIMSTVLGGGYQSWNGTSMATPHVTGTIALLAALSPGDSMATRIKRVLLSVDAKANLAGKCVTGGRLNAATALAGNYYEQTDSTLLFTGTWLTGSGSSYSGGSYRYTTSTGASMNATFNGTGVTLIATTASNQGTASISLDGTTVATVNLFSSTTKYQQKVWKISGLSLDRHTLVIRRTAGLGQAINVDALWVIGTLVGQQPAITQLSPTSGSYLGGTSVTITGSAFVGVTAVTFDGLPAESYKVVSATQITAVAPAHPVLATVQVQVANAYGASADTSADNFTYVVAPRRYEETDGNLYYRGTWSSSNGSSYSGGSYRYTSTTWSGVTVAFNGTAIDYIARTSTNQGLAHITLDGFDQGTWSLYSSSTKYKQKVWGVSGLAPGDHTLVIEYAGVAGLGGGKTINVDAFDVLGTLNAAPRPTRFEEIDPDLVYAGTWISSSSSSLSGGKYRYANSSGASVTIAFNGTAIDYIAKMSSNQGLAHITLDGLDQGTWSLYSSTTKYKQIVWGVSGLAAANHTLLIEWTGTAGPGGGTTIDLDALDVMGALIPVT